MAIILGCNQHEGVITPDEASLINNRVEVNKRVRGLDQDRFVTMKKNELKIHYRIIGKGPIDVIFIPGWTNPETVFSMQYDYFSDKARCIYIDLPGTGLSDAPTPNTPLNPIEDGYEYTMQLMVEAIQTVLKKEGIHQFVGVGFSMGATVLPLFERLHPDMMTKLVIIDGTYSPWPTDPVEREALQTQREDFYMAQLEWDETIKAGLLDILVPPALTGDLADELKEWGQYFITFPSDVLANTQYHSSAEDANELVAFEYPILCFFSNPAVNMDFIDYIFPGNETYFFPDGGHVIHWMFHEDINPIIWEFVKDKPGKKY